MARSLLEDAVAADARLAWSGDSVRLAAPLGHDLPLEAATYVVVDLETTGLRPGTARICEIGAVRIRELELGDEFQTLANPGAPLGAANAALTGLPDAGLRVPGQVLRHRYAPLSPRAPGRAGDRRGAARADRARPGARRDERRRPVRARLDADATRLREALAGVRGAANARRLPLPRPV